MNTLKRIYLNSSLFESFALSVDDNYGNILFLLFSTFAFLCIDNLEHTVLFTNLNETMMKQRISKSCKICVKSLFEEKSIVIPMDIISYQSLLLLTGTDCEEHIQNLITSTQEADNMILTQDWLCCLSISTIQAGVMTIDFYSNKALTHILQLILIRCFIMVSFKLVNNTVCSRLSIQRKANVLNIRKICVKALFE